MRKKRFFKRILALFLVVFVSFGRMPSQWVYANAWSTETATQQLGIRFYKDEKPNYRFYLNAGETIKIPTGIKAELDNDKVLLILPRSSLGFKYRLQLDNTVGVIDSDYYNNKDNEGHIFIKITNDNYDNKQLVIKKGEAIAQGLIVQFFVANGSESENVREGGIGSTNGK